MKFVVGGIAGFAAGFIVLRALSAKGVNTTPAPCGNGGCMVPALIALPILGALFGGFGGAAGVAVGEAALVAVGLLGHVL